jgi:hypothetical protein
LSSKGRTNNGFEVKEDNVEEVIVVIGMDNAGHTETR